MGFSNDPIHAHASQEAHYSYSTESRCASSERMATTGGKKSDGKTVRETHEKLKVGMCHQRIGSSCESSCVWYARRACIAARYQ